MPQDKQRAKKLSRLKARQKRIDQVVDEAVALIKSRWAFLEHGTDVEPGAVDGWAEEEIAPDAECVWSLIEEISASLQEWAGIESDEDELEEVPPVGPSGASSSSSGPANANAVPQASLRSRIWQGLGLGGGSGSSSSSAGPAAAPAPAGNPEPEEEAGGGPEPSAPPATSLFEEAAAAAAAGDPLVVGTAAGGYFIHVPGVANNPYPNLGPVGPAAPAGVGDGLGHLRRPCRTCGEVNPGHRGRECPLLLGGAAAAAQPAAAVAPPPPVLPAAAPAAGGPSTTAPAALPQDGRWYALWQPSSARCVAFGFWGEVLRHWGPGVRGTGPNGGVNSEADARRWLREHHHHTAAGGPVWYYL